jgi:hypothetical protein
MCGCVIACADRLSQLVRLMWNLIIWKKLFKCSNDDLISILNMAI